MIKPITNTTDLSCQEAKLHTLRVLVCNQSISPHKPVMPIPINNGLPQTAIDIGKTKDDSSLWVLYDTGAALSTGHLDDHTIIYEKNPELVFKFETSDDPNGFNPIKLGAAVKDSNPDSALTNHGLLTAVIWYHTPFNYPSGKPFYLMFALSKDVAVSSIIGWPMILELEMNLLVSKQQIHSPILNVIFLIVQREAHCNSSLSKKQTNPSTTSLHQKIEYNCTAKDAHNNEHTHTIVDNLASHFTRTITTNI